MSIRSFLLGMNVNNPNSLYTYRPFIGLLLLICLSCTSPVSEADKVLADSAEVDMWIKGGQVIDGTGQASKQAEVLTRGERIIFVGKLGKIAPQAKQIIEAEGMVVTPGFIDPHAHGRPLEDASFPNFLAQGVTTIFLGQDGSSPKVSELPTWREQLAHSGSGPNIGLFIGHGTLRHESGVGFKKDPDLGALQNMYELLEQALDFGVWGMSTGLEYTPGMYAGEEELQALAQILGKKDKMIMSHIRNEDDDQLDKSLEELISQGKFCRVHVSHMKSVYGKGKERGRQLLSVLARAREEGGTITADVYPYTASYTTLGIVFPEWARPPNEFARVLRSRRQELGDYLRMRVTKRNGPAATLISSGTYSGRTLEQVATEKGMPFEKVLMEEFGPTGTSAAYFVMNEELQETLLKDSLVMVSSDGSPTMQHPRGYGSFAKIIESFVIQNQVFSLEEGIRKMTSLPAQTIGIVDRGTLQAGMKADILVFNPQFIHTPATFESPHQLAVGMDHVIINGKWVESKELDRYGKLLLSPN
ncbi:MAG: amidohydrolase family protein [Bacteroidota bacterium]